jgi:DNA-binding MarR family transcriptional regulator
MSFRFLRAVRNVKGISATEQHVLFFLADMADDHGSAYPSQDYIAAHAFLSERTVRSTLSSLERKGLIQRVRNSTRHGRKSDTIMLCLGVEDWPKAA